MSDSFSPSLLDSFSHPDQRRAFLDASLAQSLPSSELEEWRYSPIGELDLAAYQPATEIGHETGAASNQNPFDMPSAIVISDGWLRHTPDIKGVDVVTISDPQAVSEVLSGDGGGDIRSKCGNGHKLDLLHRAFNPAVVDIRVGPGVTVADPILVVHHHSGHGTAAFPHLRVTAEPDSDVRIIETFASPAPQGLTVPVTEFMVADAARLSYVQFQDLASDHWLLARQFWQLGSQSTARGGVAAFGGRYARTRIDTLLEGRGADSNIGAVYYADGSQVLDFRVFQHHLGQGTRSDLLFKGTQDDKSTSVYTGMIHIHPTGAGSNAFQTNRNLKLSEDAWAWSVPNLEIENDDVRCSHASTISPVDEDHAFYLQARGVPPTRAERLVVGGFFADAIDRLPVPAVQDVVAALIIDKLNRREES